MPQLRQISTIPLQLELIKKYSNNTNRVTVRVIKYIPQTASQRLLAIVILIIVLGIAIVVISKHRRAKE